jgi:hypothetical protein
VQLKSNSNIFTAEIDPSHYALELISKMLIYEHDDRISSGDVVNQLKTIKQKVIIIYTRIGKRIVDRIGLDQNFILISIHFVIVLRERRRVASTMFK